jgi:hypothetical protein
MTPAQHHYARKVALQAHAAQLLAQAEKSLAWLADEREAHYQCCSTITGEVPEQDDRDTLARYDHDIAELQALIFAAKGEA